MKTIYAFAIILFLAGCGSHVTGSNDELSGVHSGGNDCTKSGCHTAFGAGGSVFANISSSAPVSGVEVTAVNTADNTVTILGTTDSLGNFYYEGSLSGDFRMTVGSNTGGNMQLHEMPEYKGCNRCHKWPDPESGAPGRLY